MNLNFSIIDQQVQAFAEKHRAELAEAAPGTIRDEHMRKSAAFVVLTVKLLLDLSDEAALDALTEGGNDFGVDAIHIGDCTDNEFSVTLFQAKYKQRADGEAEFPQNGVEKIVQAIGTLFDPEQAIVLNPALAARVEEIRSLIRAGNLPHVRAVLCNNGKRWNAQAQGVIDRAGLPGSQVRFDHSNPDHLVEILQSSRPIHAEIRLDGQALIEEFNFKRVLIGKIRVAEIRTLFDIHGDGLLEKNIRRYLGRQGNRVNEGIAQTLQDETKKNNFYFLNNGITVVCEQLRHSALQEKNWIVRVDGMQIINGGQTCKTIQEVLGSGGVDPGDASVLIRIYELPNTEQDFIHTITYATNNQSPVDLRDLRSNDEIQKRLEVSMRDLGFQYHRRRGPISQSASEITSSVAAQAVFSVWRRRPHQAKFYSSELFGKFYDLIFNDRISGAECIIAVLLFRLSENRRKRPREEDPLAVRYASHFYAMVMGEALLRDLAAPLDHRTFSAAKALVETQGERYLEAAITRIETALADHYQAADLSLQRLSAVFRREDLLTFLKT